MRRRPLLILIAAVLAAGVAAALLVTGNGGNEEETARTTATAPGGATAPPEPTERERRREPRPRPERERPPADRGRAETGAPLDGEVRGAGGGALTVGISDQQAVSFEDPRLRRLGVRHARLVMAWDAPLVAPADVGRWLAAVEAAGAEPLIVFNHRSGDACPRSPCSAPSPARFERSVRALRRRFPQVTEVSTWNEPNHPSQPLARRPELLARYHEVLTRACRGCRVLAADFVADGSAPGYVRAFTAALGERPRLWGVHNYPDTNRFTDAGTRAFLRLVDGAVWITETGGIVEFTTADGRAVFRRDARRAARATRWMFRVARSSARIERLYVYQWRKTSPMDRFDAGLVAPDGRARPALSALRREIAR